ncbi:hypothetical protein [Methanoregula sp.]|uniref:hypothetical protein n=1 Tax=Methanoregula sp. TaxID=2052170 RepID=UPI003BAF4C43
MEKKYLVLFTVIGAAIAVYGFVTLQVVLAALLLVLVFLGALYVQIRSLPSGPASWSEGWSAIIAGAVVAGIFVMLHVEFLLWAIAIAALLLIQQSLARIERRLEKMEKSEKP